MMLSGPSGSFCKAGSSASPLPIGLLGLRPGSGISCNGNIDSSTGMSATGRETPKVGYVTMVLLLLVLAKAIVVNERPQRTSTRTTAPGRTIRLFLIENFLLVKFFR